MKKKDALLGLGVVFTALVMMLVMKSGGIHSGSQVRITVDGEEYGVYALNEDQEIEIDYKGNYNKIRISGGEVFMEEAGCPDGYCMRQGRIKDRQQTIVCLPHKLVVEVAATDGDGEREADGSVDEPDTIAK